VLLGVGWRVGILGGKQRVKGVDGGVQFLGGGEAGAWNDVEVSDLVSVALASDHF